MRSVILKYVIFIFFGIVVFTCQFCQKKKVPLENYNITIPQVIWDYGYFKTGTYWVYKDSIRNVMDSTYVVSDKKGLNKITEANNYGYTGTFEWFNLDLQSTRFAAKLSYYVNQTWAIKSGNTYIWKYYINPYALNGGTSFVMDDKMVTDHQVYAYTSNGVNKFINFYSLFKIDTTTYKNVVCWEDTKSAAEQNNRTIYYIARDIGIIKKVLVDSNYNWKLIRKNIVK